jgi:hypothetical protein
MSNDTVPPRQGRESADHVIGSLRLKGWHRGNQIRPFYVAKPPYSGLRHKDVGQLRI